MHEILRPVIHLSWNVRKWARNAKNKKCIARYFAPLFSCLAPLFSLLVFRNISRQGRHSREKSKDFVGYFFAALIEHKICMKCEKCVVIFSILWCVSRKTLTKCEKCIASIIRFMWNLRTSSLQSLKNCVKFSWKLCEILKLNEISFRIE